MARAKLDPALAQEALDTFHSKGQNKAAAATELNLPRATYRGRYIEAQRLKLTPTVPVETPESKWALKRVELENEIRTLRSTLREVQREEITRESIRKHLFALRDYDPNPPKWMVTPKTTKGVNGVPILFASDWQWGEVIQPAEINNFNAFNIEIAHERVRTLIQKTIGLLYGEFRNPSFPGIVFALGGDMVSGDSLHEDLTRTNAERVMPIVLELVDVLAWCIDTLLEHFPRVHIPSVPGNHGRTSRKPPSKELAVPNNPNAFSS
jgi:hypothetical protein